MKKILVLNGPNLNMLGKREPHIYGSRTLSDINADIEKYAASLGAECDFFQSNHEGALVDIIHTVDEKYDGCVLNAGAYTHYSIAIRDAISSVNTPFIEVHISEPKNREEFRHISVITDVCKCVISGHGEQSYHMAIKELCDE